MAPTVQSESESKIGVKRKDMESQGHQVDFSFLSFSFFLFIHSSIHPLINSFIEHTVSLCQGATIHHWHPAECFTVSLAIHLAGLHWHSMPLSGRPQTITSLPHLTCFTHPLAWHTCIHSQWIQITHPCPGPCPLIIKQTSMSFTASLFSKPLQRRQHPWAVSQQYFF